MKPGEGKSLRNMQEIGLNVWFMRMFYSNAALNAIGGNSSKPISALNISKRLTKKIQDCFVEFILKNDRSGVTRFWNDPQIRFRNCLGDKQCVIG